MPVHAVSFLALLSPVVATILGWLVLDQSLAPLQLVGAALVAAAVIGPQLPRRRPLSVPPPSPSGVRPVTTPRLLADRDPVGLQQARRPRVPRR